MAGFGYAVNLTMPDCSEWGYAPFRPLRADDGTNRAGCSDCKGERTVRTPAPMLALAGD